MSDLFIMLINMEIPDDILISRLDWVSLESRDLPTSSAVFFVVSFKTIIASLAKRSQQNSKQIRKSWTVRLNLRAILSLHTAVSGKMRSRSVFAFLDVDTGAMNAPAQQFMMRRERINLNGAIVRLLPLKII